MFLERALYRDKKLRFNDTIKFINNGKIRKWPDWIKKFQDLLSAHLVTISNANISSSENKTLQIQNETSKVDLKVNLSDISESSLNAQIQQIKNLKTSLYPLSATKVDNPNPKRQKRRHFKKSKQQDIPKDFDESNPLDWIQRKNHQDNRNNYNNRDNNHNNRDNNSGRGNYRGRNNDGRGHGRGRGRGNPRYYSQNHSHQNYNNNASNQSYQNYNNNNAQHHSFQNFNNNAFMPSTYPPQNNFPLRNHAFMSVPPPPTTAYPNSFHNSLSQLYPTNQSHN